MCNKPKWYAVYTKPRWEKKVAELLARQQIDHYCPLNKVTHQWSDRKKIIEEPLFKSYVFIRVQEDDFSKVRETSGVLQLLYWLGKPAVIQDYEIETIKQFLAEHRSVRLIEADVSINDVVKITQGPLMSKQGNVIEITNHFVKIVLPSLRCALVAQVHKSHIEKIRTCNDKQASA